jgi:hypothetical protein
VSRSQKIANVEWQSYEILGTFLILYHFLYLYANNLYVKLFENDGTRKRNVKNHWRKSNQEERKVPNGPQIISNFGRPVQYWETGTSIIFVCGPVYIVLEFPL